jgi:hypothetical protein
MNLGLHSRPDGLEPLAKLASHNATGERRWSGGTATMCVRPAAIVVAHKEVPMPVTISRLRVSAGKDEVHVLVTEALDTNQQSPVLLFLHGKGEFGSNPDALPLVLRNQSPAFQAIQERLRNVTVISPQFLNPNDDWNWRTRLQEVISLLEKFRGRRIVATGFSRGGLGVLQLFSSVPSDTISKWAIVDPQRADPDEEERVLPRGPNAAGWLRFGNGIDKNTTLATKLGERLEPRHSAFVNLGHGELAIAAYGGDKLHGLAPLRYIDKDVVGFSPQPQKIKIADRQSIYEYLDLTWQ